jgi:hypothetical protein
MVHSSDFEGNYPISRSIGSKFKKHPKKAFFGQNTPLRDQQGLSWTKKWLFTAKYNFLVKKTIKKGWFW